MPKSYKDRSMKVEETDSLTEYFFPKANPPVTIRAISLEEAEEKLKALNKKEV